MKWKGFARPNSIGRHLIVQPQSHSHKPLPSALDVGHRKGLGLCRVVTAGEKVSAKSAQRPLALSRGFRRPHSRTLRPS